MTDLPFNGGKEEQGQRKRSPTIHVRLTARENAAARALSIKSWFTKWLSVNSKTRELRNTSWLLINSGSQECQVLATLQQRRK